MNKKTALIIILILAVLILLLLFNHEIISYGKIGLAKLSNSDYSPPGSPETNLSPGAETGKGSTGSSSASQSGSGAGSDSGLPLDLETRGCGYYFEKYGVCSGTCPSGECISEGRSCYCKII